MARRSHKLEPINIQDFYEHPSLNGLVSFLDVPTRRPEPPPPVGELPPAPGGELPPEVSYPEGDLPPATGRRQKVRKAVDVQDGHSPGEQCLYSALWTAGTPETAETRLVTIGFRGMSILCKLERSNCKKNTAALIQKLAIEVTAQHDSLSQTGHTYRVFSFKEILRRRKAAGMLWVVRTSGVRFVRPPADQTGSDLPPGAGSDLHPGAGGKTHTGAGGKAHTGAGGKTPPHIGKDQESSKELLLSAPVVHQALTEATGKVHDNDAALRCIEACREQSPDVTEEEVARLIHLKAPDCKGKPVVYLGKAVANHCSPETLKAHREKWGREEKQREDQQARESWQEAEDRAMYQRILDDPNESEADKALARKCLSLPAQ